MDFFFSSYLKNIHLRVSDLKELYSKKHFPKVREVTAKGKRPLRESGGQPFSEIKKPQTLKH